MPSVRELIDRAEQCHREEALEVYNAFSGLQDKLDIVSIYKRYPELFSRETYDFVAALGEGDVAEERERRMTQWMFTRKFISDKLKELIEDLENAEAAAQVEVDGESHPYLSMVILIGREADYPRRGRLNEAYLAKMDELNPQREELDARGRELVLSLGYRGTIDLCQKLAKLRIYPVHELTGAFLRDTDALFEERLERFAARTGTLTRASLRHADLPYLWRASRFDALFPVDDMVPALRRTLSGLGIDLDSQPNATLDLEARPKKRPRAFCIGIDTPRDVRLVLKPRGGQDDYSTLFHEAGHLEFGAHMSPTLSFLYRNQGDTSVHESYAFLLEHLLSDRVWWREVMHTEPVLSGGESYLDFTRFHRLFMFRRYSAKLHYEVEYDERGGGPPLAEAYSRWLIRGTGVAYPRQRYLEDFDSGFYVVQYLQAWIWEVQLREHLRQQFGEAWFTKRSAGDLLKDMWAEGMKYDVWEVAARLGYPGLSLAPLTAELSG